MFLSNVTLLATMSPFSIIRAAFYIVTPPLVAPLFPYFPLRRGCFFPPPRFLLQHQWLCVLERHDFFRLIPFLTWETCLFMNFPFLVKPTIENSENFLVHPHGRKVSPLSWICFLPSPPPNAIPQTLSGSSWPSFVAPPFISPPRFDPRICTKRNFWTRTSRFVFLNFPHSLELGTPQLSGLPVYRSHESALIASSVPLPL